MGENGNKRPKGGLAAWRPSLIWAAVLIGIMLLLQFQSGGTQSQVALTSSEFDQVLKGGQVKSVQAREGSVNLTGELRITNFEALPPKVQQKLAEMPEGGQVRFKTTITGSDEMDARRLEIMEAQGVEYTLKETPKWGFLSFIMPVILVLGLGYFLFGRLSRKNMGMAQEFSRSHVRQSGPNDRKVTFEDVAGCEEAKEETRELIDFLTDTEKFRRIGARIPRGVLLSGPPGTGKTLIAKAIAGEAGVPFFSITGSDFVEMFVGVGAARVRDLFETGRKNAPCIIFIDEIDAVGRHRGSGLGNGNDEREQTLNALLVGMDGFEENDGVIVIAATNRPDVLDPALLRPGRFDRQVVLDVPDMRGREEILKVHARKVRLAPDADLSRVAKLTTGLSGAELENIINEAALLGARGDRDSVTMEDLEAARDKVCYGTARKSRVIPGEDRRLTAVHEAGHAVVMALAKHGDPVHKVSILPRGQAAGATFSLPEKDRMHVSREELMDMLVTMHGGRAAEELVFGFEKVTTGASNDLKRATELARRMVCEWAMSDKLPARTFGQREETLFLGRDIKRQIDYSDETAKLLDDEIDALIETSRKEAGRILSEHRSALDAISEALLQYEEISGDEVKVLLEGGAIERQSAAPAGETPAEAAPESGESMSVSSPENPEEKPE